MRFLFGPFCLDATERVLLKDGKLIPVPSKALNTLLVLLRSGNHLVEKDALMKEVWPDEFVEEGNLAQHIYTLRKVLEDTETGIKYIETIPRRGYRFLGKIGVTKDPPAAKAEGNEERRLSETTSGFQSMAVLPLHNASGKEELDDITAVITKSIIDGLSSVPEFYIVARQSGLPYDTCHLDAQRIGNELNVGNVLFGSVRTFNGRVEIRTKLVDVTGGWQFYGRTRSCGFDELLSVHEKIVDEISSAVRIRSSSRRENTNRHTENTAAYQAYLKGRYSWSKCTAEGLGDAVEWFRQALCLDPGFAIAYAAIVDCYLRLSTDYFLPPRDVPKPAAEVVPPGFDDGSPFAQPFLELRNEWDRKSAERESNRAIGLKSEFPASHQWYAACIFARKLYEDRLGSDRINLSDRLSEDGYIIPDVNILDNIQSARPTRTEEIEIFLNVAREQIEAGNYEAACLVMRRWWIFGKWPKLDGLSSHVYADLLFTAGSLATNIASTRQVPKGQKHAEELLNGAIALFEQLDAKTRCAEARIELGLCYQREGLFDLARNALMTAVEELSERDHDLKSLGLVRLASLERASGRFCDAMARLNEASKIVEIAGPWVTGRHTLEMASTLKNLAAVTGNNEHVDPALAHHLDALYQFEAVGHHRLSAIVENNYGQLLLALGRIDEADEHLARAWRLFDGFNDKVRRAQVDETIAQLFLAREDFESAEQVINRSVKSLEIGGENAILAESLRTQAVVLSKLGRSREAERVLDRAEQIADQCGDADGVEKAIQIRSEISQTASPGIGLPPEKSAPGSECRGRHTADSAFEEMLQILGNSRFLLDQVLGYDKTTSTISRCDRDISVLAEIVSELETVLDERTYQTIRGKILRVIDGGEKRNGVLLRLQKAIDDGLNIIRQSPDE